MGRPKQYKNNDSKTKNEDKKGIHEIERDSEIVVVEKKNEDNGDAAEEVIFEKKSDKPDKSESENKKQVKGEKIFVDKNGHYHDKTLRIVTTGGGNETNFTGIVSTNDFEKCQYKYKKKNI